MPRFYLIDQSLKSKGGHHLDYACRLAHAADDAGFDVFIAGNRRFRNRKAFDRRWQFVKPFRYHMYSEFCAHNGWSAGAIDLDGSILPNNRHRSSNDLVRSVHQTQPTRHDQTVSFVDKTRLERQRRIESFVDALSSIFKQQPASPGDLIFLPSVTEFDLVGLARFMRRFDWTRTIPIHAQFHFGMCESREFEWTRHRKVFDDVRRQLDNALKPLWKHKLFLYATTEPLARQYSSLGVRPFARLPYPVHEQLSSLKATNSQQSSTGAINRKSRLRIATPGAVREEKGQQFLTSLVHQLWSEGFRDGRLQLALQSKPTRLLRRPRQVVDLDLSKSANASGKLRFHKPLEACFDPIVYCRHPLPEQEYLQFVQSADIGVLLYDAKRYYARHAGILGEFLTAGVPVIVPAGCWLADQIEVPTQKFRSRLWDQSRSSQVAQTMSLMPSDSHQGHKHSAALRLDRSAVQSLLRVKLKRGAVRHDHVRLECDLLDDRARAVKKTDEVIGLHGSDQLWFAITRPPKVVSARLQLSFAYHDSALPIDRAEIAPLTIGSRSQGSTPTSSTTPVLNQGAIADAFAGQVAATPDEVPRLLRNIIHHYSHYHRTARELSLAWADAHHPMRTLECLTQQSTTHDDQNSILSHRDAA